MPNKIRLITKSYDNGVSTWYRIDLSCGHNQQTNTSRVRIGDEAVCFSCRDGALPRHVDVSFAPTDNRNPGFGYTLTVKDAVTGEAIFQNDRNPHTGSELLGAEACLEAAKYYC